MAITKYGIISDIHKKPEYLDQIVNKLKVEEIDKLILNGDIGDSWLKIFRTLEVVSKLDIETYIQPGSHESVEDYSNVVFSFCNKYSNFIDVIKNQKIENKDHDLVFLPGSDFLAGGGYLLGDFEEWDNAVCKTQSDEFNYLSNIRVLDTLVSDPDKTISICHVPRKFNDLDSSVDYAYFAESATGIVTSGEVIEKAVRREYSSHMNQLQLDRNLDKLAFSHGFTFKRENRGNEELAKSYESNGITKAISGHFHESSHRAHDSNSILVPEGQFTDNLFYNSGAADYGLAGILCVDGNKVAYKNINVKH